MRGGRGSRPLLGHPWMLPRNEIAPHRAPGASHRTQKSFPAPEHKGLYGTLRAKTAPFSMLQKNHDKCIPLPTPRPQNPKPGQAAAKNCFQRMIRQIPDSPIPRQVLAIFRGKTPIFPKIGQKMAKTGRKIKKSKICQIIL